MKPISLNTKILLAALLVTLPTATLADDGAASVAAGGLVFTRETRIVMAKEVLTISPTKVVVDYDFRNDTDDEVTTEIAFPIPPYEDDPDQREPAELAFRSFRLSVDGKPVQYETESKATLKGKDVSSLLRADRIDIATFGHEKFEAQPDKENEPEFFRLPDAEKRKLVKAGLYSDEHGQAMWTATLKYHWTQSFPAHSTVHIRHEYEPVVGYSAIYSDEMEPQLPANRQDLEGIPSDERLDSFCAEPSLLRALKTGLQREQAAATDPKDRPYAMLIRNWVDFILTTANTWQRPIEDFTLIIERPHPKDVDQTLVSFCSPGPVEKTDADYFQVHLTNFVPTKELHIGFFEVPAVKSRAPMNAQPKR